MPINKLEKSNILFKFFTKNNGFSNGLYKSLNCGIHSKDDPKKVRKNILFAKKRIGYLNKELIILNQGHTNKCITVNKNYDNSIIADGVVSKNKNLILGIVTADCLPIVFYDNENSIVGICHAGWRGLSSGIIKSTITRMIQIGSKKRLISSVIGPCIRKNSYEVNKDFLLNFKVSEVRKFTEKRLNKIYFDLPKYACHLIRKIGIQNIKDYKKNTYLDKNYFSYRESISKKYNDYGRNLTLITIKSFE